MKKALFFIPLVLISLSCRINRVEKIVDTLEEIDLQLSEQVNDLRSQIDQLSGEELEEVMVILEGKHRRQFQALEYLCALAMLYHRIDQQEQEYLMIQRMERLEQQGFHIPSPLHFIYERADSLRAEMGIYIIMEQIEGLVVQRLYREALEDLTLNRRDLPHRWSAETEEEIALMRQIETQIDQRRYSEALEEMSARRDELHPVWYTQTEARISVHEEDQLRQLGIWFDSSLGEEVLVEAGSVIMGVALGYSESVPGRTAQWRDFYISKTEVTQNLWELVMGNTVQQQCRLAVTSRSTGNSVPARPIYGEGPNYPIYYVSWVEAVEFCNRLSLLAGLTPCYSEVDNNFRCDFNANGYRLPTEGEWEYAARGGQLTGFDAQSDGSYEIGDVAWYELNSDDSCHPVAQRIPNALGLYDMFGNVFEWCWEWYDYEDSSVNNPGDSSNSSYRVARGGVARGGAWNSYPRSGNLRWNSSIKSRPDSREYNIGLRLVRTDT